MYEWDEAKNRANIQKHGIGFQTAIRIFDGPVLTTTRWNTAKYARSASDWLMV
jgi:uncharacterized DUF497 family protein